MYKQRWALLAAAMTLVGCAADRAQSPLDDPGVPLRDGVRLEMRQLDEDGPRTISATAGGNEAIRLVGPPFVTASAIAGVRMAEGADGKAVLQVTFTDAAAPRIQRATERMIFKPVAVVVDGRTISTATVSGAFGHSMQITGIEPAEAERLLQQMTGAPKATVP